MLLGVGPALAQNPLTTTQTRQPEAPASQRRNRPTACLREPVPSGQPSNPVPRSVARKRSLRLQCRRHRRPRADTRNNSFRVISGLIPTLGNQALGEAVHWQSLLAHQAQPDLQFSITPGAVKPGNAPKLVDTPKDARCIRNLQIVWLSKLACACLVFASDSSPTVGAPRTNLNDRAAILDLNPVVCVWLTTQPRRGGSRCLNDE